MEIRRLIYRQPLNRIVFWIVAIVLLWAWISAKAKKRRVWLSINVLVLAVSLIAIVYLTLYNRNEGISGLVLIPFYSLQEAKIQPEFYRSMLMNVFLFVPFGLAMTNVTDATVLSKKSKPILIVLLTIAFGFFLSATIEYLQYRYSLGRCEVDDVIMNTLGTAIGASSIVIKVPGCIGDWVRKSTRDE